MLAWSSLSRTSHFRSAGTTMRRQSWGCAASQTSSDAVGERGRLVEQQEGFVSQPIELSKRGDAAEHLGRERVGTFLVENPPEPLRQQLFRPDEVDGHHRAVAIHFRGRSGHEVQRHERRERPVNEAGRQTVMLRDRQPLPD
jgi:hypothetical protein